MYNIITLEYFHLSPSKLCCCFYTFYLIVCHKWASQVALVVKNLPANSRDTRDAGLIPESGRSPGGGNGNPLQYSCLENPIDRGAWQATVHEVAKSRTRPKWLSTCHKLHVALLPSLFKQSSVKCIWIVITHLVYLRIKVLISVLPTTVCSSKYPPSITFFLREGRPLAFLVLRVFWWVLSAVVCL